MSERTAPYWIGNVVQMRRSQKTPSTGPDNMANKYDQTDQKSVAKVLQLTTPKKKTDAPQPKGT